MKFINVSILFICLIAITFSNWFLIAAYKINQQYISEVLCVNKSNPSMHCNGHCFLNRQLTKEEKPISPLNAKNIEKLEIQLFCIDLPSFSPNNIEVGKTNFNQQESFTAQQFVSGNFHPPQP